MATDQRNKQALGISKAESACSKGSGHAEEHDAGSTQCGFLSKKVCSCRWRVSVGCMQSAYCQVRCVLEVVPGMSDREHFCMFSVATHFHQGVHSGNFGACVAC